MTRIIGLMFCCVAVACSRPSDDASKTADALKSAAGTSATSTASNDPACKLFSSSEAARYVGKATKDGDPSFGGCQWDATDGNGDMNVQIVPARYHEKHKGSPGYRTLSDAGSDGFVATYLNGWEAGAIVGKDAIHVNIIGDGASEASTIALLKEAIRRHG